MVPAPRSMYLPPVNADALNLKIESLQAQLAEQRQLATEQVEALRQDRQLRQQVRARKEMQKSDVPDSWQARQQA